MSPVTEVDHLRAEVARLEAELAAATAGGGPAPTAAEAVAKGAARVDRSIEILTAILDGHPLLMLQRLNEIGFDTTDQAESGMFYMGQVAASLLHGAVDHARGDHGVACDAMAPIELVRLYARSTAGARDHMRTMGAPKAGG